ncbi:MAG: hypothetical protein AB7S26_08295 [Sandaracinaceae bacterium]
MSEIDARLSPRAVRLAQPLIEGFVRSPCCPETHEWHARYTLPLLALWVAMNDDPREEALPWASLDPDALFVHCMDLSPDEPRFIRDLFDVAASFYGFLGTRGVVSMHTSEALRARLAQLAMGASALAA